MKAFVVALVVAGAIGVGAYFASRNTQVERPVATVFTTQGVRL